MSTARNLSESPRIRSATAGPTSTVGSPTATTYKTISAYGSTGKSGQGNYAYGRYLGEFIDSMLVQAQRWIETIVVADGSTDRLLEC